MMNSEREITPPKGLVLNNEEWNRINRNLSTESIKIPKVEADTAYEEYLKNESRKMTAKWDNTIEKVRQRKLMDQKRKSEEEKVEGMYEAGLKILKRNYCKKI